MPFIEQKRRDLINEHWGNLQLMAKKGIVVTPGDICYKIYETFVDEWAADPRWSTVHRLYKNNVLYPNPPTQVEDYVAAAHLAWQVFFHFHVIPYEEKKRAENGDITGCPYRQVKSVHTKATRKDQKVRKEGKL